MHKGKYVVSMILMILITGLPPNSVNAEVTIKRLAGQTRYDTCQEVSKNGWTTSENVIIANGENYPDALGACTLSHKYNAPILLLHGKSLRDNPILTSELKRLKTKNIIILGGTGVVSQDIENSLKQSGYNLQRLCGEDRYTTAIKIAEKIDNVSEIVISNSEDFSGSLSVAPIAGTQNIPIILVSKDEVPAVVQKYLKNHNIKNTYVMGDKTIISESVASIFPNPRRILGNTRYSLNESVVKNFKTSMNFDTVYITSGEGFADALSGIGLAAKNGNPIIFASNGDNSGIKALLSGQSIKNNVVLGGEGVLPKQVINDLFQKSSSITDNNVDPTFVTNRRDFLIGDDEKSGKFSKVDGNWQYTSKDAKVSNIEVITVKVWDYVDKNDKSKGKKTISKSIEVNRKLSGVIKQIFDEIYNLPEKFPINDVSEFRDKDSCINHPAGAAIDINPDSNYYIVIGKDGKVKNQVGNHYDPKNDPYSITQEVIKVFQKYGWDWGGNFQSSKDYMHFSYLGG
ncbi:cell wall-binding repeat-containing protein [Clostridiaceae bacterium UIB06]|uniref:Cell wall-binding repeat-containing protein n=1 Tax=Clostridium thailandense TaxID=2794346 RepID=A0A949TP66_9CLOT|nr:cell wall-binding repeat-containing protein [Clostridium thailandense]MBV7276000.1 cell wall-binding repeat-containing protein [Clostridium thailandense]MCH5138086.1 cell wall-binding repeat-containing protein [Clostridiaceae bacterium UIB06]